MHEHEQPQWQSIGMLPMLADMLAEQLDSARSVVASVLQAQDRPHVMDDFTINRVIVSHTEQRDFILAVYPEQTARWRRDASSEAELAAVARFEALYQDVVTAMNNRSCSRVNCRAAPSTRSSRCRKMNSAWPS